MGELGPVTRHLLGIARDAELDDRGLARRICEAYVGGLAVGGAAISLMTASSARETLWASDPVAELLEDLQLTLGEGASVEAATTGRPVLVRDLSRRAETARWPVFAAAVAEQSAVRALLALPLQWGTVNLGVLSLYRTELGGLTDDQWRDALSASYTAALMILGLRTEPNGGHDWIDHEMGQHAEIHQATGMVLVQLDSSATDALARMRGYAFVNQLLLIDIAREVVARRLVFAPETP